MPILCGTDWSRAIKKSSTRLKPFPFWGIRLLSGNTPNKTIWGKPTLCPPAPAPVRPGQASGHPFRLGGGGPAGSFPRSGRDPGAGLSGPGRCSAWPPFHDNCCALVRCSSFFRHPGRPARRRCGSRQPKNHAPAAANHLSPITRKRKTVTAPPLSLSSTYPKCGTECIDGDRANEFADALPLNCSLKNKPIFLFYRRGAELVDT
jgi:hypothetical protein